jgi:hypothetical protein
MHLAALNTGRLFGAGEAFTSGASSGKPCALLLQIAPGRDEEIERMSIVRRPTFSHDLAIQKAPQHMRFKTCTAVFVIVDAGSNCAGCTAKTA